MSCGRYRQQKGKPEGKGVDGPGVSNDQGGRRESLRLDMIRFPRTSRGRKNRSILGREGKLGGLSGAVGKVIERDSERTTAKTLTCFCFSRGRLGGGISSRGVMNFGRKRESRLTVKVEVREDRGDRRQKVPEPSHGRKER